MPLGELITTLSADWRNYEKDLNKALKLLEEFHGKTQRLATTSLQARQRATAASGGSAGLLTDLGTKGNTEAFERYLRRQSVIAEAELRRMGGIQERAENENVKRTQLANKKIEDDAKASLARRVAEVKANNTKINALAAEELKVISANAKARADAEKEFQQFVGQSLKQGGQGALVQARELDKTRTEELKKSGIAAQKLNTEFAKMKEGLKEVSENAKNFAKFMGVGFVVGGIGSFVGEAIKLNRELQLQKLTLAANLALTTKIVDANGQYVGKQRELNLNIAAAGRLIQQIRKEAQQTTLTEQELRPVVGRTLGLAMRAGASQEQGTHLIAQLANLAKIAGVQGEQQLGANIRGVLTGRMVGRLPLGQLLGLDPKQVTEAKEAGTLIDMLLKKLAPAQGIIQQASASFDHLWSTLISKAKDFIQLSTEKVFERLTGHVLDLNKAFSDEKIKEYAEIFSKKLVDGYNALEKFVSGAPFKSFVRFFEYVVEHAGQLLAIFGSLKALQALSGGGGGLTGALGGLIGKIPGVGLLAGVAAGGVAAYQVGGMLGEQAGRGVTPDLVRQRSAAQAQLQAAMQETAVHRGRFSRASVDFFGERSTENRLVLQAEQRAFEEAKAHEEKLRNEYYQTGTIKAKANQEALHRISRDNDEESQKDKEDREKQRLDVAKQIADYTNNKIQARRVEFEQTKASALQDVDDEKLRNKLIAAAYKAMVRDIHQIREDGRLEEREARAKTAGDEIAALKIQGQKEFVERSRTIRDRLQNEGAANKAIAQLRTQINAETNRKVLDKQREFFTKATDLAKQYHDLLRKQGEERLSLNKELHDAEYRHAKEMATLVRERIAGEEELQRATAKALLAERGVGIREGQEQLRDRARAALTQSGELGRLRAGMFSAEALAPLREGVLQQIAVGQGGRQSFSVGQLATAAQGARELQESAYNQAVESRIDEFLKSNPGFATQGGFLSQRQAVLERDTARQQLVEDRRDLNKPVEAAQGRLSDLGDQIKEANLAYAELTKSIRDKFKKAVDDIADGLIKLAPEMKKFLEAVTASHIALTPAQAGAIRGGTARTPAQIRQNVGTAVGGGTPLGNFAPQITFNITNANPDHIVKVVTTELEKLSRRTAFR